jgi:putative FmdB family regulatory protein
MPLYAYECSSCGYKQQAIRSLKERNEPWLCDQCGTAMERDFPTEGGAVPVGTENAKVFWSDSLAISPSQATEHRAKFPDVLVDRAGRVGFTSHKQRERYIEKCGFYKKPAKLRR